MFEILELAKQKLSWYHIIRIVEVIFHFLAISHIFACIFIDVNRWDNNGWTNYQLEKLGLFEKNSLVVYVNAVYWAFTCLSHGSLGDIRAVSNAGMVYNSIFCLLACFVYPLLFGNISSLIF